MTNPTNNLALRLAQSLPAGTLSDIDPAVRAFDPTAVSYLEEVWRPRVLRLIHATTQEPQDRVLRWCVAGLHARMALLVLVGSVGSGPTGLPFALNGVTEGDVRQNWAFIGGYRTRFVHDRRRVAFLDDAEAGWRSEPLSDSARTVAELVADARRRRATLTLETLAGASALGVLLSRIAPTAQRAQRRMAADADRRGLVGHRDRLQQLAPQQLKALLLLAATMKDDMRNAVVRESGVLTFADVALSPDGTSSFR